MPRIAPEMLALLVCPVAVCRAELAEVEAGLACRGCGRVYRIADGVPVLIPEEATQGVTPTDGSGSSHVRDHQ